MVQEFNLSITPVSSDEHKFLVRVESKEEGVPLGEEQVTWPVEDWLLRARKVFTEPLAEVINRDHRDGAAPYKVITLDPLSSAPAIAAAEPALIQLGQELYDELFQGTIGKSWLMAQGVAQHNKQQLRLRLGMKGEFLPRLPWEVLHMDNRPLAASKEIIFSRYHSGANSSIPSRFNAQAEPQPTHALQILMVLSAPTDQANLELKREALQLQQELEYSRAAEGLTPPEIELTLLEQPGRELLTERLEQAHYQVFHFAGHSSPGPAGGQLHLVNASTGLSETLNGDDLAGLLANNGIQLAVFNSCLGTQAATSDEFDLQGERTLAEALIHRGIPSVLAMAERIPDQVALNLSRLFYRNLKSGHPMDISLCRARQGLVSSYGSNQLYWALPILYLQPSFEGRLVQPAEAGAAQRPRLPGMPALLSYNELPPVAVGNYRGGEVAAPLPLEVVDLVSLGADPAGTDAPPRADALVPRSGLEQGQSADRPWSSSESGASGSALTRGQTHEQLLATVDARALDQPSGLGRWSWSTIAAGTIAALLLMGGVSWGVARHLDRAQVVEVEAENTAPPILKDFREANLLSEAAIDAFNGDELDQGIELVTQLLDRNALDAAEGALGVLQPEDLIPETNFLLGRLHWQQQFQMPLGPKEFDNSFRYWYFALQGEGQGKNGKYLTAVGFAAYAKGELGGAQDYWQQAVDQLKQADDSESRRWYLSAKAGLALLEQRLALQQPLGEQAELLERAIRGYKFVREQDEAGSFNPLTLGTSPQQNWLWNRALIEEWRLLSERLPTDGA